MSLSDSEKFISEALDDYKEDIDKCKPDILSVSGYKVIKPWGHEIWLELNQYYAYKIIHMKAGNRCSLQAHKFKHETNYVIDGEAEVFLENEKGDLQSSIYKVGTGWTVPIGRKHRVVAKTDYTALEVSTPHLNDVIRFEDDTNRVDGKIDHEHKDN